MLSKKLGKYEIIEWLGGGRFGDVFLARDTIIDKDFALKISRMRREEINMLKDEARLLAALNHPNIVRFFNIDFIDNKFVLVMEYIKGETLRDIISEGGIPIEQSMQILNQMASALVYAHANRVLHRDLKPENVLITQENNAPAVRITDFGLARFIRSGSISASSAGTPIYMAPETWAGKANEKSDLWSLGIIFYELLTGIPPFLDDSLEGLKRKIEKHKYAAPTTLRHDIPEGIEDIALSMLTLDPKARPSAQELSDHISETHHAMRAVTRAQKPRKSTETLELTPVQEEVLAALDGPVLVLGQAGCGKTTTLTCAVKKLIDQGIPAAKMLICTFTNKAANDIRERLQKSSTVSLHDLWLGTFHKMGFRMLCRDAERLDMSPDFTIRNPKDIFNSMQVKVGKYRMNAVIRFIEQLKALGITPGEFKPQNAWERTCHDAYLQYETYKKENRLLDYDDLTLYATWLLKENDDIRQYYQSIFDYIFIDELQDINPAQYQMVKFLCKERIFLTGDEDQSIYGWRGADRDIIYRVPKDYEDIKIFSLTRSFRLAQGIIDVANNLMRREATILPAPHAGDVLVYAAKSEQDESRYVIREIKNLRKEHFNYRDIAILCRMNSLAHVYEEALAKARVPHTLISGSSFHERADIKPIFAYLSLLEQQLLGSKDLEIFIAKAQTIFRIPTRNRKRAEKLYQHHWENLNMIKTHQMVEDIADLTGHKGEHFAELHSMARNCRQDLAGFLNEIRLVQELDLVDWAKDLVKVMTVHSAKGLEFPAVFVVDLVEDVFPLTKKMASQKEIEEERRLCYVALTRAQKKLYLIYPKWRQGRYQHPSRFLVNMLKGED
ncbi:MAG: UvrD-helicase domain-containing protein [candidate division WOR-3 bacterium]